MTGHLHKRPNNGKDRLGLKFCEILVSLRPMDLVSLIFTCNQQTSVLPTCKHNLINHFMQNLAQRGLVHIPPGCLQSLLSLILLKDHLPYFNIDCYRMVKAHGFFLWRNANINWLWLYNEILSKLKWKIHVIVVLLLHTVSTGPCHQQKFWHDSRCLHIMIKSNFTVLNSVIFVHTNHVCYSCFIHS